MSIDGAHPAQKTYDAMAPAYDDFTSLYEADNWTAAITDALLPHGLSKGRLLDVGCGTGKSIAPMIDRGWTAVGVDISESMLEVARQRLPKGTALWAGDMRTLPVHGGFDLVWSLNDAINYLLSESDLRATFEGFRGNLRPSTGLVAFDLNTAALFEGFFSESRTSEIGGRALRWEGVGQDEDGIWVARMEGDEIEAHLHRQRHFSEVEVRSTLAAASLETLDVLGWSEEDGELQQPLDEDRHLKALYIARPE